MRGRSMTEGTPWKHILRFALPVFLGSLLQQLYNTVDTIIVGNFASELALSAVGTTGSFVFLFLSVATGLSAGNGIVVAQFYGAKDEKQVRANASTGIMLLIGLGIAAMIVAIAVSGPAFTYLVKVPSHILNQTLVYFRIYAIGLIFQFGYNIFASILRAVGDSAATLYFLLISSVVNVILDLAFVAGLGFGVAGAAAATVIAQAGSFIAAYFYMTRKYPMFRFKLADFKWDGNLAKKTIKAGFPIALQMMVVSVGLTFIQRAVNEFGQTMTASFTVASRIEMYIGLPATSFQTTMATYTGQNIGAGRMDRVNKGIAQTMLISTIMTVCISLCIWIFSGSLCGFFGLGADATVYCNAHLKAIAFVNVILCSYIPVFGVFQGANHPGISTITALVALGTRVAVTYLFRYSAFFGYTIIWWNGLFGFGAGLVITWLYFASGKWKNNASLVRM